MKEIFPEFYINKNELDFKDLGEDVLVVFDTNTLLDLYRASSKLREELMKSIRMVKGNVWMPYQVGHEFHNKRKELMHEIQIDRNSFIETLKGKFDKLIVDSIDPFKKKNKLYEEIIENHKEDFEKIKVLFESETQKIENKIKESDLVDYIDFLEEIFEGKVEDNKDYEYEKWEQEALERYGVLQPPGYKDYNEKKDQFTFINGIRLCKAYGDFFLWKELLLKSKDTKIKEVVFVTNDQKEDWVYETKGRKVGARVELVEEMMRKSSASFRIYSTSAFLYHTISQENYKSIEKEATNLEKISFKYFDLDSKIVNSEYKSNHFNKMKMTNYFKELIEFNSLKNLNNNYTKIIDNNDFAVSKGKSLKAIDELVNRLIKLNNTFDELEMKNSDNDKIIKLESNLVNFMEILFSIKVEIENSDNVEEYKRLFMKIMRLRTEIDKLELDISFLG